MAALVPLREKPQNAPWKKGDVLVIFGELFSRGYANGLVEEAERLGMTIVRATVGRREKDGALRALNDEEAAAVPKPFINIPLEAGFDMEPDSTGKSPIDYLKDVKLSEWESATLDFTRIEESRKKGEERFRKNTAAFLGELKQYVKPGQNILFAHLMAGGVPRTKIVMPLINRVVKGTGERYVPSQVLWDSPIGKFVDKNFHEVTARTLYHLLDLSTPIREALKAQGSHVSYLAYGYHGTEALIDGQYRWQTYTPYVQGWAKIQLENIAKEFHAKGVPVCVYNCPEILTNSSSIFQGVEVSLYNLIQAYQKDNPAKAQSVLDECAAMLTDGPAAFEKIKAITAKYFNDPEIKAHCVFEKWPQHTSAQQLETMLNTSEELIALHKDPKQLITFALSEKVFEACGTLMLHDCWKAPAPVAWIGHDVIARIIQ